MSDRVLDLKGMSCPLPVLRANRALRGMAGGERIRILATDPAAVAEFKAFCQETGHALLAWSDEAGILSFTIRRRPDPDTQAQQAAAPPASAAAPQAQDPRPLSAPPHAQAPHPTEGKAS